MRSAYISSAGFFRALFESSELRKFRLGAASRASGFGRRVEQRKNIFLDRALSH